MKGEVQKKGVRENLMVLIFGALFLFLYLGYWLWKVWRVSR